MNAQPRAGIFLFILTLLFTSLSVQAQLNVNFSVDKTAGCSPLTVSFTNRTTGASASAIYKWDLGNGNTSAFANPSGIYTGEQSYTVTLTVQDGAQTASKTATITVHPKPVVDFTASVVKGCIPVNTSFVPTVQPGSGNVTSCYWDFGDGVTQQAVSGLSHNYTQPQKASVILTATNSYGCYTTVSKKDYITVLPALKAGFTAPNPVCRVTDPVPFTDTSSGPGTLSYAWNFSDGNTSTQKNPVHVYNTKGVYSVTQTVTSSEGCVASKTLSNLNVAMFKADFTVPPLICAGSSVTFANTSNPSPVTYNWYVNNQQNFYYNSSLYYYFNTPATYTIKLVNTLGACKDSVEKQVSIKPTPNSTGFLTDIKGICGAPVDVEFRDTTLNAVKWEWIFDTYRSPGVIGSTIQNPVHNYTIKDQMTAMLTVTNSDGCKKTISKYVNVLGPQVSINFYNPDEQWKNARTCTNNRVGFRTYTSEEIVSYNWNFGDGATSTDEKPVHIYTKEGNYKVSLTYTTKSGCTQVVSLYTDLTIGPESKITDIFASSNTVCGNAPITFTANVSNLNNNWPYYYWDFGDGTSTGVQMSATVNHQYFRDSTYTVRLIWMGGNGNCPDTMTKTGFIKVLPPIPDIVSWKNTCDGQRDTVTFEQRSIKAQTWTWDFGDGSTKSYTTDEPVVSHVYANTGRYKVVLTTTNGACSVRDSVVAIVVKKQRPLLTANATEVCKNSQLTFNISNVEPNPYTYNQYNYWVDQVRYGDDTWVSSGWYRANFESTVTLSATDFIPGKKDMKVIIARHTGSYANSYCYDTTNVIPLTVKGPLAGYKITTNNVCYNSPAVFQDTSISIGGTIQKWEWNFGDGQTAISTQSGNMSHIYNSPGTYWVGLKVTDNSGCQGSPTVGASVQVTGPIAAFYASANTIELGGTVNFSNTTNNYNTSGTTYRWQINGVDFSTNYNSSYTFNQNGSYTITLIATNGSGCTSSSSQVITVKNFNAAFSIFKTAITPNSCPPVLVRFTNNSQNYTFVRWDFGDGTIIDNVNNPSHFYEKAAKYKITLYVYGPNGLSGTYYDSVTIVQPEAVMQSSALDVCKGASITLNAKASNTGSYVWDFGDGSVVSTTDTFATHQYASPGLYSPTLIMKQSVAGCTGSVPLADKINVREDPVVIIAPAQPVICKGASISLQASGGVSYEWLPATDLSDAAIANPVASPAQTSTYTVKVADDIGCKNTGNVTVTVVQPMQVAVSGDTEICLGESTNLKASGADVYKWINDISGLNNINIPNPVATPGATATYTVSGSDAYSCFTSTADITVQVRPLPTVNAGQDVERWPGEPVQLQATGSSDVINWKWTPADYLSCTDCADPVCTPLNTTSYVIAVKNQYGCAATDTVVVKLLCNENKVRIPNGFTPNGDGKNDEFIIKGIGIVKHLVIFNRWGQKVYDRSNFVAGDRASCWNGTINGYPAETGTYVYFVELECPEGTFSRKGTMTLVR